MSGTSDSPESAGPLVSPEQLIDLVGPDGRRARDVVVFDVRWYLGDAERGRREYAESHVPGAVFVDLPVDLGSPTAADGSGGRHPLPTVAEFAEFLGRTGVSPDDLVVAYDGAGGAVAARLWWMLRSIRHRRVAVLDGGVAAWVDAGGALTGAVPERDATAYPVASGWLGVVDADEVARLAAGSTTVVDARAAERYRGEVEPIDRRAGHVPGAINLPHLDNLGPDGRHRPTPQLVARFDAVGADPVVYCGSGVTACHDLLAMAVAGIDGRLYPGSWSEWSSDPGRPVATGDQPG